MSRLGAANTRGGLGTKGGNEGREGRSAHTFPLRRSHCPSAPAGCWLCREKWGSAARQSQLSNKAQNPDISVKTLLIFKCWQQIPNIFKTQCSLSQTLLLATHSLQPANYGDDSPKRSGNLSNHFHLCSICKGLTNNGPQPIARHLLTALHESSHLNLITNWLQHCYPGWGDKERLLGKFRSCLSSESQAGAEFELTSSWL